MSMDGRRGSKDKPVCKIRIEQNIKEAAMDAAADAAVNAAGDLEAYFEHLIGTDGKDSPGWAEIKNRFAEFHLILEPEQVVAKAAGKLTENLLRAALASLGPFGVAVACVAGRLVENFVKDSSSPSEAREGATEFLKLLEIVEYIKEGELLQCEPFQDMLADEIKHQIENLIGETPEVTSAETRTHRSADSDGSGPESFSFLLRVRRQPRIRYTIVVIDGYLILLWSVDETPWMVEAIFDLCAETGTVEDGYSPV